MSKELLGASVRFTGFTDEQPDNGEHLVEGETYTIESINEPDNDDEDTSYNLHVANPDYAKGKRSTKNNPNPEFLVVDVFPDEFEVVSGDEEETKDTDSEDEASDSTLDYADVKVGMVVTVDDGDEEGAVTGTVTKTLKTKMVIQEGDELVDISVKNIVSITAAEQEEDEQDDEEQEEEKPAAKKPAAKKPAAKKPAAKKPAAKKPAAKKPAATKEEEDEDLKGLIILTQEEEDSEILELVDEADDLCALAHEMAEETAAQEYRLGGVLYHVQVSKEYKALDSRYAEKGGFALYVSERLGLGYRKALYLVEIYSKFNKYGIDGSKVAEIGWTKAQAICGVMDSNNAEKLVELAEASTVSDLKDSIKEDYTNKPGGDKGDPIKRVTFKFRLMEDAGNSCREYFEQAKEQLGATDDDSVFEHIVSEWAQEHLTKTRSRPKSASGSSKPAAKKPAATRSTAKK